MHQYDLTFFQLIEIYDEAQNKQVKTATKNTNISSLNILSKFHDIPASDISTEDINDFLEDQLLTCKLSYVNKTLKYIKKIYNWAHKQNYLPNNQIRQIPLLKQPDNIQEKVEYYTSQEWDIWDNIAIKQLRNKPKDLPYYIYLNIMYYMGMRTGEVRALKIEDIQGRYVDINKTCTTVKKDENEKGYIMTSPKTKSSYRKIQMPEILYQRINEYLDNLCENGSYDRKNFLCGGNTPLVPQTVARKFQSICRVAGLPIYRPYVLRHSHASLLINAGALDHAVANRLGHSVEELRKTYFHLFETSEANCVSIIEQFHPSKDKSIQFGKLDTATQLNHIMSNFVDNLPRGVKKAEWQTYMIVETLDPYIDIYMSDSSGSIVHKRTLNKSERDLQKTLKHFNEQNPINKGFSYDLNN